jgi:hypothetical protein
METVTIASLILAAILATQIAKTRMKARREKALRAKAQGKALRVRTAKTPAGLTTELETSLPTNLPTNLLRQRTLVAVKKAASEVAQTQTKGSKH